MAWAARSCFDDGDGADLGWFDRDVLQPDGCADIQTRVGATAFTDAGVLAKIKNVDGIDSGLDADLLDGLNTSSSDQSGNTVVTRSSGNFSANVITANLINAGVYVGPSQNITFEGPTDNTFETVLTVNDPGADLVTTPLNRPLASNWSLLTN